MRFVETHVFTKLVCGALDDDDYGALQITLLLRPEQGPLIPGSGGLRKMRWGGKGTGKRGGLRVMGGVPMKTEAFDQLTQSVRQAGRIRRGKAKPSRVSTFAPADVKAIRNKLGKTQQDFALMIGVSVATLRNWEQGRRTPEGPALALLRVASAEPRAVARALRGAA
jgi:putative transcriptional regulator